jgi:hypothetical protein
VQVLSAYPFTDSPAAGLFAEILTPVKIISTLTVLEHTFVVTSPSMRPQAEAACRHAAQGAC